ncbi:MAG TPA: aminobenzoate oxygenase, partial [Methylomirabilota bacterium]|nr:aminobenzoate oxygenase [Methylomirabilota bacterium]
MDRRVIPSPMDTVFEFDYAVQAEDMRGLYEKAKRDQWNASRDIAWDTPEPEDGRPLADELVDIYGSPLWDKLS